jgi:hypothetical protein
MNYYDMDGNVITIEEWSRLFEGDQSDRIMEQTTLPGDVLVSTVLLGIDHNFGLGGPPIIFETMVFGPEGMGEQDMDRYATKEQAREGHARMVTKWTGWTPGDPAPDEEES